MRDHNSGLYISCPSPKPPAGAPGGTKYAMKRPRLRTHSFLARSTPSELRNTYQATRLDPVSQNICSVPLPKPPSPHPHGLVHATAIGTASFTQSSASGISPAIKAPIAAVRVRVRLPCELYG